MPGLQLRYSEGYDASLAGWTGALDEAYFNHHYDAWLSGYVQPAQEFIAQAQAVWDGVNDRVFDSFRQFGWQFYDLWPAYGVHRWPGVVGFKDPLTFFVGSEMDEVVTLLIHELVHCHEDFPANQPAYEAVRRCIFDRFTDEPIAVRYHIITLQVQWAVLRRVFPERWQNLADISSQHPLLQRAAQILKRSAEKLEGDHPLESLLNL